MHRFGSKVTILERSAQILSHEDVEIAEALANCLQQEGIELQLNAEIEQIYILPKARWASPFARPMEERNGLDLTCWSLWDVLQSPRTWFYPLQG
jgi:NADPH-dependent 2,4-dienoyl-CoA reductase/sulfur reductase-like enzyme